MNRSLRLLRLGPNSRPWLLARLSATVPGHAHTSLHTCVGLLDITAMGKLRLGAERNRRI